MEKVLDKDKVMESINKLAERVGMLVSENEEINERIQKSYPKIYIFNTLFFDKL